MVSVWEKIFVIKSYIIVRFFIFKMSKDCVCVWEFIEIVSFKELVDVN